MMTTEPERAEEPRSPEIPAPVLLNIGAGGVVIDGHTPLDIKAGQDCRKLGYPDASVDGIYASHVLEHIPYEECFAVLREWVRVLKPGGVIRIAVPDMARLCAERTLETKDYIDRVILGGHVDEHDRHLACFDAERLRSLMGACGIGRVRPFEPFADDCSKNHFSLNLEGVKRAWPRLESPRVCLVLSQPRLSFTDHSTRLLALAQRMKFAVQVSSGAFWDRDMEAATMAAIRTHDPDMLLYSDYDSVFEPADVEALLEALNADASLAAVGSVQMSRHDDRPLVFDPRVDYSAPVTDVDYQHFGLTLVRADVFRELPLPWFWSVPGQDTGGGMDWSLWNRSDADITFWRSVREHGFRVAQHNGVCIGHMVLSVKWPAARGRGVMLDPIENYNRRGKPPGVGFRPELYLPPPAPTPDPAAAPPETEA